LNGNNTIDTFIDARTRQGSTLTDMPNGELKGCIYVRTAPAGANTYVGFNGDPTKMVGNAYSIDTLNDSSNLRRYSIDTTRVEISSKDDLGEFTPNITGALYQKGPQLGIKADINLRKRQLVPSIGLNEPIYQITLNHKVTNLVAAGSSQQLSLSWTAPAGITGITDYSVQSRVKGTSTWTTHSHGSTSTTHTITSLSNGTIYEIRVAAIQFLGTEEYEYTYGTPFDTSLIDYITADAVIYPIIGKSIGPKLRIAENTFGKNLVFHVYEDTDRQKLIDDSGADTYNAKLIRKSDLSVILTKGLVRSQSGVYKWQIASTDFATADDYIIQLQITGAAISFITWPDPPNAIELEVANKF